MQVTNTGLVGSTVVNGVHFKARRARELMHGVESALPTVTLPKALAPGEHLDFVFKAGAIIDGCLALDVEPKDLTPVAMSGHGRFSGKWAEVGLEQAEREYRQRRSA